MLSTLIAPIFAMMLLTFLFSLFMGRQRMRHIKEGRVHPGYFKTYQIEAPESIIKTSRHYSNLFELPVLFYVTCLVGLHLEMQTILIILLSWMFVISRVVHMIIHIGRNVLIPRALSFIVGWLVLIGMWIEIIFVYST